MFDNDFQPTEVQVEWEDQTFVFYVTDFDPAEKRAGIEWIVNRETGEIVTDEWFDEGVYRRIRRALINELQNQNVEASLEDALSKWL